MVLPGCAALRRESAGESQAALDQRRLPLRPARCKIDRAGLVALAGILLITIQNMPFSRIPLPPIPFRFVLTSAIVLATAIWLWVIAYWVIQLSVPMSSGRPILTLPTPDEAARIIASRHLFGRAEKAQSPEGTLVAVDSGAVRVLGLASSDGSGKGFAIVSLNGKPPVPAIEGQEFAPGLRLLKVTRSGIEFERGGVVQSASLVTKEPADKLPGAQPRSPQGLPSAAPSATMPVTPNVAQ
jgi:hypothetical protein